MDKRNSTSYDSLSTASSSTYAPETSKRLENSQRPEFIYEYPPKFKHLLKRHPSDAPEATSAFTQYGWANLTIFNKLEMAFCFIFLLVPRIIIFLTGITILNVVARIAVIGLKIENPEKPDIKGFRAHLRHVMLWIYRATYIGLGVWWIDEYGEKADSTDAPVSVIAPHTTMVDTAFFGVFPFTNVMSPISTDEFGFLNVPMRMILALLISREKASSRKFVVQEMQRRIDQNLQNSKTTEKTSKWPSLIIFPEGTCGNGEQLCYFKPGAFIPGAPVQPIYLEVKNAFSGDTLSFTWADASNNFQGTQFLKNILGAMLSLRVKLSVHYLPVYTPSQEEKDDPYLYAFNVRQVIADHAEIPVIDMSYEDGKIMELFTKFGGSQAHVLPQAIRLFKTYCVRLRDLKTVANDYFKQTKHIINKETGLCKLADYAHCYNLDEHSLRSDFFKDLLPVNTDSISVLVALESVLKTRENISTQLIDSLDTDRIVKLVSEGKIKWKHDLSSEQNMFDFLQVYPQFTIVKK